MREQLRKGVCLAVASTIGLAGCATSSKDIAASYVSPMQYASYDCDQLNAEAQRIQGRVVQLGGRLDEAANNDKALTAVGIVLFWPALFFLGGTKQQEAEYARLKGEYDAVQQAAVQKRCPGIAPLPQPQTATTGTDPATTSGSQPQAPAVPQAVAIAATTPVAAQPAAMAAPQPSLGTAAAPAPPTQAAAPSAATGTAVAQAPRKRGESSFEIERMGREKNCDPNAQAWLLSAETGGIEFYSYQCNSGDLWTVRCELRQCRVLK